MLLVGLDLTGCALFVFGLGGCICFGFVCFDLICLGCFTCLRCLLVYLCMRICLVGFKFALGIVAMVVYLIVVDWFVLWLVVVD